MREMRAKFTFIMVMLVGVSLVFTGLTGLAAANEDKGARAKGVIVEEVVPESQFNVKVSTDKTRYKFGEIMHINVRSDQAGYLTLYDIQPDGKVNILYPNRFHQEQKIQANKTYKIPAPSDDFRLKIGPPRGRDILWAVVSSQPGVFPLEKATKDAPFPQVSKDAGEFAQNVKGVTVEQKKAWGAGYSVFYIGKPLGGHIHLETVPKKASIYLNGSYRGKTPMTIYDLKPGNYQVKLTKQGYQNWTTNVQVQSGMTQKISKSLVPVPKNPTINSVGVTPSPSSEGQQVRFSAQASVPGGGPLTYTWNIAGAKYTGKSVGLTFNDNRNVNWTLQVTSGSGGVATTSGTHVVNNVPPTINSVGISPQPSTEAQKVSFSASASDPGKDSLTYSWTIAGMNYSGPNVSLTFNDNAQVNWSLKVTDDDGGVARTSGTHVVENVPPTISSVGVTPSPSTEGQQVNFSASATDPGQDSLTYTWTIAGTQYTGSNFALTFNDDRKLNWTLQVSDGDGGVATTSGTHVVETKEPTTTNVYVTVPNEGKVMKAMYNVLGFRTIVRNLDSPHGIACSPSGRLYVAENESNTITSFSQNGGQKSTVRELSESPLSLTFGPNGDLFFTTDQGNIWRLGQKGQLEKIVPQEITVKGVTPAEGKTFSGDKSPYDIEFLTRGKYAGDMIVSLTTSYPNYGKVVRLPAPNFDRVLPFINSFQKTNANGAVTQEKLRRPTGLAVSRNGDVLVSSFEASERYILRYASNGDFLGIFTKNISRPNGLEIDWHQRLYATTASFTGDKAVSGSLRRYRLSGGQMSVITRFGAWGIAICER